MEDKSLKNKQFIERTMGLVLIGLLIGACLLVLRPFFSAMLWAAILVFVSWPVFQFVTKRVARGRAWLSALVMTLMAMLLLLLPLFALAKSSLDIVSWGIEWIRNARQTGIPQLVEALRGHPVFDSVAEPLRHALTEVLSDTERLTMWCAKFSKTSVEWMIQRGISIGYGIFQVSFCLVFMFFFYLHGKQIADWMTRVMERLTGPFVNRLRRRVTGTLNTVVRGTVGTALVQTVAAALGYGFFDVPNVMLFASLTFVLSLLPFGPAVLWVPIGLWLIAVGRLKDGIGILIYGILVVSSIDNVVRPLLTAGSSGLKLDFLFQRRRPMVLGAMVGLVCIIGFLFAGLPWWLGVLVFALVAFTAVKTAGVIALLSAAIWLFASGSVINGVWLFLLALALLFVMPVLEVLVMRFIHETPGRRLPEEALPKEEGPSFAIVLIGLTGGMIAFGFIGLFLGPVLLALGYDLIGEFSGVASDQPGHDGPPSA